MPFDSEGQFVPADPADGGWTRAIPRIVVHPKQPLPEGIDNWLEPGTDPDGGPNDWFVPGNPSDGQFPNNWLAAQAKLITSTGEVVSELLTGCWILDGVHAGCACESLDVEVKSCYSGN
jgi:hypothetical protein